MRIGVREGLLDGVDGEKGSIGVAFGMLQKVDVDELLDVSGRRSNVLDD